MPHEPKPKTNLLNRLTTAEIRNLTFTNDQGEKVDYQRLALGGELNGEELVIEVAVDKKDLTILRAFSPIKQNVFEEE